MARVSFDTSEKIYADGTVAVVDLSLEIPDGELMVFVGPSGCGKTTALRMVAGLEEITDGEIRIGDEVVNEPPAARSRHRDGVPELRALSAQERLREPRLPAEAAEARRRRRSSERVTRIAIHPRTRASNSSGRPRQLSGGQRQRVAMGRALVREPQAFLMDEPLSNLDAKLRTQMRAEIGLLHKEIGVTTIYVTHDQIEAMTLGERVAVMRLGELQQVAHPAELYTRPANLFVAGFIGSPGDEFLRGRRSRRGRSGSRSRSVAGSAWPSTTRRRDLARGLE